MNDNQDKILQLQLQLQDLSLLIEMKNRQLITYQKEIEKLRQKNLELSEK